MKTLKLALGWAIAISTTQIIAQPVVINPMSAATQATQQGTLGGTPDNTGCDYALVNVSGVLTEYRISVGDVGALAEICWVPKGGTLCAGTDRLGLAIGLGVTKDPDVVSIVSASIGLGTERQHLLVTYLGKVSSTDPFWDVYIEMFEWNGTIFTSNSTHNISINGGTEPCNNPNIDADYQGNYAVTWEEAHNIYIATDDGLGNWGSAPTNFMNISNGCNTGGDEEKPDVCIIHDATGGGFSLINVTYIHATNSIAMRRVWTNQVTPGLSNYPSVNCGIKHMTLDYNINNYGLLIQDPGPPRIACPSEITGTRSVYDFTVVFSNTTSVDDIYAITHDQGTYGLGWVVINLPNISGFTSYPAQGTDYNHSRPVVAYKDWADEYVIAWEFQDHSASPWNAYTPTNNNVNLVAVLCDDAGIFVHADGTDVSDVTGTTTNKNRISLSRNNPNDLLFSYVDLDFAQMEDIYSDYSSPNLLLPQEHQKPNLIEMGQRTTSVNEIELYSENKIFVYPNPLQASNRTLYLSGVRDLESVSIQLLDMNGREIQKVENVLDNLILLPSDLQKGSYILNILSQDQSSQIKLVVN